MIKAFKRYPPCAIWRLSQRSLVAEGAAVAQASGVQLAEDTVARIVAVVQHFPPQVRSSQYDDLVAGRRWELEVLNGTIVRLGHACFALADAVSSLNNCCRIRQSKATKCDPATVSGHRS